MRAYQVSSVLPDERPLPAARLCCSFVSAAAAAAAHLVHTAQPRSPAAGPARLLRPRSHCPGTARPCLCSSCLSPCLRSRSFPSSSPACPSLRPCNSATPCHLLHPFSAYYALLLPRILVRPPSSHLPLISSPASTRPAHLHNNSIPSHHPSYQSPPPLTSPSLSSYASKVLPRFSRQSSYNTQTDAPLCPPPTSPFPIWNGPALCFLR